jgi:hypothetical protein
VGMGMSRWVLVAWLIAGSGCGGQGASSGGPPLPRASLGVSDASSTDGGTGCDLCIDGGATGASDPCADGGPFFFRIDGDGPTQTFETGGRSPPPYCSLEAFRYPIGAHLACGEGCGGDEAVWACATADGGARTIFGDMSSFQYVDANGHTWLGPASVTYSAPWSAIGTPVEGTFTAPLILASAPDSGATLTLSGSFRVCHAYDSPPAP